MSDWYGARLWDGGDLAEVRARLAAGADPGAPSVGGRTALHTAAESASPDVVAAMARAARDLDGLADGRSALWEAVYARRHDNARVLAAAGADPWLPMMAGWSPGRLSLAGPEPDLFPDRPVPVSLTPSEAEAATVGAELRTTLDGFYYDGTGLLCVAGVDAVEAVRRLGGSVMTEDELLAHYDVEVDEDLDPADEEAWRWLEDIGDLLLVGITDVPGGCVVTQPWGYQPQTPVVGHTLSVGTVAYGLYANPKSGNQGSVYADGECAGGDLHPGGDPWEGNTAEEVLLSYLYRHRVPAYSCAYVGLRPPDARAVTGPADVWVLLPDRDYWRK